METHTDRYYRDSGAVPFACTADRYERLDELYTGEHNAKDCLFVTLHTCPKCDESDYLTVKHVKTSLDSDGDEQKDETDVVKRLAIPHDLALHLQEIAVNPLPQAEAVEIEDYDEPDVNYPTAE